MGTFDQLNFRMNGYQFHVDLMAGKEKWTDDQVKAVFAKWTELLPFHQPDANGRTWQEAAQAVVDKQAGMMTIGNFIGQQFPEADQPDLDFFPWPEMNPEFGADTIEAPIDGFMMARSPKNEAGAKELLYHFGTAAGAGGLPVQGPERDRCRERTMPTPRATPRCRRRSSMPSPRRRT